MSLLAVCVAFGATTHASQPPGDVIVEVVGADGKVFTQVPARREARAWRAYLEAERDARYRIRIRNATGVRVGVVIAVDGRNIISGARSELGNDEPMYILDAWQTREYSGWRATLAEVNEFYFTDWKESYAEAFGDRSARGVIAVAAYREKQPRARLFGERRAEAEAATQAPAQDATVAAAPSAPAAEVGDSASGQAASKARRAEAGTGYGDRRTEHVTRVVFDGEARAAHRVFLKYEWRETLCSRRILDCEDSPNRFWPGDTYGFAPPPPKRAR